MANANYTSDLSVSMTRQLLEEMRSGRYKEVDRLPPEMILAKEFGVSRTMLRDCLSVLEREGFISRQHGVGTVINRHIFNIKTRMDMEEEFLDMVTHAGYEAKISYANVETITSDSEIARRLQVDEGESVYKVSRVITADGIPAIYCIDYIARNLVRNPDFEEDELKQPIFIFIEKYCEANVHMDITEVKAVLSDIVSAEMLNIQTGQPLLYMDEIGYDFYGKPILYSQEYYPDGIMKHTVFRKKI